MKQLSLLFFLLFGLSLNLQAQECMADTTGIPDTAFGVFPLPFIEVERPDGGIQDTVCLNSDFEYTFTVKFGKDTLSLGFISGVIEKVAIDLENGVTYDPPLASFSYVCNPPNCVFEADSIGCVKIYGQTSSTDDLGRHEVKIAGDLTAFVPSLGGSTTLGTTFPNDQIAALAGNYYLFVQEENSPYCSMLPNNTYAVYAPDIELANRPNPFSDFTQIHVKSREEGAFELRVMDMLGQLVRRERLNLHFGENIIDFDGRELANGLYVYTITDGRGGVSGKMVVNHGR